MTVAAVRSMLMRGMIMIMIVGVMVVVMAAMPVVVMFARVIIGALRVEGTHDGCRAAALAAGQFR